MSGTKKIEITPKELAMVVPQGADYVIGDLFGDERDEIVFITRTEEGQALKLAHRLDGAKRGFAIHQIPKPDGCTRVDSLLIADRNNAKQNELKLTCKMVDVRVIFWMDKDQILEKLFPNHPDIQKRYR